MAILVAVSPPELSVVCKSCGSEVSPYVTECPYCGNRIRKRAPKLEREGDEIKVHESRRDKRRRLRREQREQRQGSGEGRGFDFGAPDLDHKPVATVLVLAVSAVLVVLQRAVPWSLSEAGAIVGPVGSEVWRYVTAPFVYEDIGALLVIAIAIAIFGPAVERRIGSLSTLVLMIVCGAGGMLAADAVASAGLIDFLVAAGGNGIALGLLGAWLMLWRAEARTTFSEPFDALGVTVIAVVLLLLPLVEVTAEPIVGLVGGLLGLLLGQIAATRITGRP